VLAVIAPLDYTLNTGGIAEFPRRRPANGAPSRTRKSAKLTKGMCGAGATTSTQICVGLTALDRRLIVRDYRRFGRNQRAIGRH
jgi:hypothetical protein